MYKSLGNPLCHIVNKADGYIEEKNRNKCFIFPSTNKSKEVLKHYTEKYIFEKDFGWERIKNLIKTINEKPNQYGKDFMRKKVT